MCISTEICVQRVKKNITVKSSGDNYSSSNSSSSNGIGLEASLKGEGSAVAGLTLSHSQGMGDTTGTANVNSNFDVGGTHRATSEEEIEYRGANVLADRIELKGKDVVVSSVQDTERSKETSLSGSVTIAPNGIPSDFNFNYKNGDGEKKWVGDQTSLVGKNGGSIVSENFTNSAGIIGSLNKEKKLNVKADNILVENLKDKDDYDVLGGGIAMSGNVSVISGKKIRRQKTNATAVNTEFEIGGEKKSSEELGFKTNLSEAQIITKDENNLLDVDLHTDLLKEEKREEITQAGDKVSDMVQAITNPSKDAGVINTYKENRAGRLFNDYVKNTNKSSIFTDTDISIDDKIKVLNNLYTNFLRERGYEGEISKIFVGKDTFAAKDGTIYISKEHLESGDALSIFAHEYGHLNSYDKGEETAINVEKKVDKIEENKENNSENIEKYLSEVREKEKDLPSVEEQIELSKIVPKDERENFHDEKTHNEYKDAAKGKITEEKINYLAEKFNVSKEEVKNDPLRYVYYNALKEKNTIYESKEAFSTQQSELEKQIANETDKEKRSELEKGLYRKVGDKGIILHNIKRDKNEKLVVDLSLPNEKFVNSKGEEVVFNKETGTRINDGINDGTFNIAGVESNLSYLIDLYRHMRSDSNDVGLWVEYGTGPNDPSTKKERKKIYGDSLNIITNLIVKDRKKQADERLTHKKGGQHRGGKL